MVNQKPILVCSIYFLSVQVGVCALGLISNVYCMTHVVQLKTKQNPRINCSAKGQSFWGQANGTWSFPHPRRPAINALPQLVFLGFPHLQPSFPNSQPKTEMSMGPIPILPPHLYPFGCKYAGAGAGVGASDANVFGCLWKQFPLVSAIKKQYHLEST